MERDPPCSVRRPSRDRPRQILWVGRTGGLELDLARRAVATLPDCTVTTRDGPAAIDGLPASPDCIVLAHDRAGEWSAERVIEVTLRHPLAPIVAISGSLADGRRRSGPALPGVEEIAWHDLAPRLAAWFADLDRGSAGSIGLPPTSRREDRILAAHDATAIAATSTGLAPVSLVARDRLDLEGLADLVRAAGHPIEEAAVGRPAIDAEARILVWDVRGLSPPDIEWLRLLSANRPALCTVILDSFPRGDSAAEALAAGAAAVLGRPPNLEVLAGTLALLGSAGRRE